MRAIETERGGDDAGLTAREWAAHFKRSYDWTCRNLLLLKQRGRLHLGTRHGQNLSGRAHTYVVYRLKKEQ